jgi:hypothetical protein
LLSCRYENLWSRVVRHVAVRPGDLQFAVTLEQPRNRIILAEVGNLDRAEDHVDVIGAASRTHLREMQMRAGIEHDFPSVRVQRPPRPFAAHAATAARERASVSTCSGG